MKNKQGPSLFTRIIALFAVTFVPLMTAPVSLAAIFYWDADGNPVGNNASTGAGLGGTGTWNAILPPPLWWDGISTESVWTNSFANTAYFWQANQFPTGTVGADTVVTLGTAISAGALIFNDLGAGNFVINSNTLTLGSGVPGFSPTITLGGNAVPGFLGAPGAGGSYGTGPTVQINSQISGTSGLAVYGGGTLILTNGANNYTGFTNINNGTVVITDGHALGSSTTAVAVNGIAGFGLIGGQLLIGGGVNGITLNRDLTISGRGSNNVGAALISTGMNTINGNLIFASNTETRVATIAGNTTFTGTMTLAGGSGHVFYGSGNAIVDSQITNGAIGNTGIIKTGSGVGGTMVLTNINNDFISNTRIDSGTLRVSDGRALGDATSINQVSFNGGTLELRVDAAQVASFLSVYVSLPNSNAVFYANRQVGGSGLNQTIQFANFTSNTNRSVTLNGGDGYSLTLTNSSGNLGGSGGGVQTYTNNSNGILTIAADVGIGDATSRIFTLNGNGDGVFNGNIISAGAGDHQLVKSSNDTWTYTGTNSNFIGGTFINAGTLAVRSIGGASGGGLNGQAGGVLSLGSTTTAGAFDYLGAAVTGAGEATSKTLAMNGTTGATIILADQKGTAPSALILNGNIGNPGTGAKTIFLGGNSPSGVVNEFHGVISDNLLVPGVNFITSLNKVGNGTWVYTPDDNYHVTTEIQAGTTGTTSATLTTAIGSAVINVQSTAGLAIGQVVSGANIPVGSFITAINVPGNTITINNNVTAVVAVNVPLTFSALASSQATTAIGAANSNVLTVASTANLRVGQVVTGVNVPNNSIITQIINSTTFTISNNITTNVASAVTLTFGQIKDFTGNVTVSSGTLQIRPNSGTSNIINNTSQITFAQDTLTFNQSAGGTFEYVGLSTGSTENVGALVSTAGGNTVKVTPGASGTTSLVFSSLGSIGAGSSVNFVTSPGGTITLTGTSGFLDAHLFYNGADFAVSNGGLLAAPIYGVTTDFAAPTSTSLTDGQHNAINGSFTASLGSINSIFSLKIIGSQTLTLGTSGDMFDPLDAVLQIQNAPGSGILQTGGNGVITGGNGIQTGGAELVVRVNLASDSLTINTKVGGPDGTVFGLSKDGAGLLTLVGPQSYSSFTTVNEGTLRLQNTTAGSFDFTLGATTGANSTFALIVRQLGTLDLNGAGVTGLSVGLTGASGAGTVVASGTLNGAGIITNTKSGSLVTLSATNGVFSGQILDGLGKVGLYKLGSGVLALTGTNTFTGPVIVQNSGSAGTLWVTSIADIGVASALGAGDATSNATNAASLVLKDGIIKYTGTDNTQSGNNVSVYQTTQTPSVSTNRLFTLSGGGGGFDSSGTFGSQVLPALVTAGTANNAALVFRNTADIVYGDAGAKTLFLFGTSQGDNEIAIHLIDNGASPLDINKQGIGLWILNPATANTYTGNTILQGGILRATDGMGLSAQTLLVLAGTTAGTGIGTTASSATSNGVFETSGLFTRPIFDGTGTLAGKVVWDATGTGGFAASSAPLVVALGGLATPTTINWSTTGNPTSGGALILNSATALSDVTFMNGINLNSSIAAIFVDDNTSTNTDFATLAGVISGSGSLVKLGNGVLYIKGANTYSGSTFINSGVVGITSFGSSTNAVSSSLGAYSPTNSLNLGNGGTGAYLIYMGNGEVSNRLVNLASTTGTISIESSGAGAVVLTNVANPGVGSKTLILRGYNTGNNAITSNLANNGGNALLLQKQDGGTWILSGDNSYTGGTIIGAGFLGITATHASGSSLGTGLVQISNGGIFSLDGAATIANTFQINQNTTWVLTGNYSLTFSNTITGQSGNNWAINNTIINGGTLTFNGNFINADTGTNTTNRLLTFAGTGNTVYNGVIQNATAGATTQVNITTSGTLTIGNGANTYALTTISGTTITGGTSLSQGTLIIAAAGSAVTTSGPLGAATAQFQFNGGVLTTTVVGGLVGTTKLQNPVILNGNPAFITGTNSIEFGGSVTNFNGNRFVFNNLTGGASLTMSGGVALSNDATNRALIMAGTGDTLINSVISDGGTATASSLTMQGSGTLTLTATNTFRGTLTVNSGTVVISGATGKFNTVAAGVTILPTAKLTLDNSAGDLPNRLTNTPVNINGGTFNYIAAAGGSTETSTGALNINSTQGYITTSGGASTLTFGSLALVNTGSVLVLDTNNINVLGTNTKILFTTTPGLSNNIIARVLVTTGTTAADFATYNGTNGLIAFSGYTTTTNIDGATSTATLNVNANATTNSVKTINGLKINGNGITVDGTGYLTLTSGGLLVTGGSNTLSVAQLAFAGVVGEVAVNAGSSLNMTGSLTGTGGWVKSLGGTLTLSNRSFVFSTNNLSDGTLVLSAGLNTLLQNQQLNMGLATTTLDLKGNLQYVGVLSSTGVLPDEGGLITSSAGAGILVVNMSGGGATSSTFAGHMNDGAGTLSFVRAGGNTLTLESSNNFSGPALLLGGTTTFQDNATWTNVQSIDINYATFNIANNGGLQLDLPNRINDAAAITLRGAQFNFTGRALNASSEKFGTLTIAEGANGILIQSGNSGTYFSGDVTFASLTRTPQSGSTVNFTTNNTFGDVNNNARLFFTATPTLVGHNALGAWAIANTQDYATYNTTNGLGAFGIPGYQAYDITFGSGNVTNLLSTNTTLTTNLTAPSTATGLLRLAGLFNSDITYSNTNNVLNLELGGILHANTSANSSIGTTATRGVLTAGGAALTGNTEIIVYNNNGTGNTLTGQTLSAVTSVPAATTLNSNLLNVTAIGSIAVGNVVTGPNIPNGTVVIAVDPINLVVTLSQPATLTANGGSFVFTTNLTQNLTGIATNSTVINSTTLSLTFTGQIPQVGMIVTGPNIQVGTTVTAVNTVLNTVTLSLPATATANAGTFAFLATDNVNGSVVINSIIKDTHVVTGTGTATVSFVKSGAGVAVLTAANTYTGGTILDQGTLYLKGAPGTVVLPFSTNGVVINGGIPGVTTVLQMVANAGQIDPNNTVFINGGGTLTLVGDNTLAALVFKNDGNNTTPTVNTAGVLTLSNATSITATSINVATAATINGFLALHSGVNTMNIEGIKPLGQLATVLSPTVLINALISGTGSIDKTNDGILQLSSSLSTFSGGIHVLNGGLMFSNNSTPTTGGGSPENPILSGPFGTGAVVMDSGTSLLIDGSSRTIGNAVTFGNNITFETLTPTGAVTMQINGLITFASGAFNVSIPNNLLTVNLLGALNNFAGVTSINKTGLGILNLNLTGFTGDINAGEGPLNLFFDANGTGDRETVAFGNITFNTGVIPVVTLGRAGATLPFTLAVNKIAAPLSFSSIANGVTVTNNQQYGLQLSDNVTFTSGGAITVTVTLGTGSISGSNVTAGLILNGILSGTPATFTKAGNGTLVLGNAANNFTVGNALIDITAGILSVSNDGALGTGNGVRISTNLATGAGFRATGTFSTNRIFTLNAATSAIEVASSNPLSIPPILGGVPTPSTPYTLTITQPFGLSAANNALQKNDNGTLEISANNATWTGILTIAAGAVKVSNAGALGTTAGNTTTSNIVGAALQLNGVSTAEPLSLNNTGIDTGGALQAVANATASTASGAITLATASAIGADSGAVLNLTGGITGAQNLTLSGAGTINITTVALGALGTVTKIGTGLTNLQVASPLFVGNLTVSNGTFELSGAGTIGATGTVTVQAGGILLLDNAIGANTSNRLGGGTARPLSLTGGTINYIGSSAGTSTETFGATTLNSGGTNTFNITQGAGQQTNLVFGALTRNQGTKIQINTNGNNLATAAAVGKTTFTIASGVAASGAGANATTTKAVIPYAVIFDGTNYSFAVLDSVATTFVRALAGTEMTSTLGTAATNLLLNSSTDSAANTTTASISYNTLTLNNGNLTINGLTTLTMGTTNVAGGILAYGGGTSIIKGGVQGVNGATATSPGLITTGTNAEIIFHVEGASTLLQVDSIIGNTGGGLTKDGAGTLLLTSQEMYTSTTAITQGTLKLGTSNVIRFNQNLRLDGNATFDMNGFSQTVAIFLNDVTQPDNTGASVGGRIINSNNAITSTFVTVNDNNGRNWAGVIGGGAGNNNIAWERTGINNLSVYSNNDYTGVTALLGGITVLRDDGRLSGTSSITVGYAALQIDNSTSIYNNNDRVNDSANIILKGGQITYVGRTQVASSEILGQLTLFEGANTIQSGIASTTGVSSADLYFNSLNPARGLGATVNFVQGTTTTGLGVIGNNARIHFLTAPTLTSNNILGAWAIVNSSDYATYATDMGVGAVGQQGFRTYDTVFAPGNVTQITATTNLTAPVTTTGVLKISSAVLADITFSSATNALNLELGGLLHSNNAAVTNIGTSSVRGVLTAGGSALTGNTELVLYSAPTTFTAAGNAAGSTVANSNVVTLTSVTNIAVGMFVTGPFVPVGTTVTAINGLTVTLSNPAVANNINGTFTFYSNTIVNSVIKDTFAVTGSGTATVSFVKSGSGLVTLTAANTYHGGTVIDQGTVILQGGPGTVVIPGDLTINGGTTASFTSVQMVGNSGQIAASSNITLNGPAILYTTGNNTFNSLTFNNDGGNPMLQPTNLNPYQAATMAAPLITTTYNLNGFMLGGFVFVNGQLTLTSNTINTSSVNAGAVSTLAGRVDFGANNVTINTTPITFNGVSIAPLQPSFAVMGIYGSAGGITIAGSGTVAFLAQDTYSGSTHLTGTTTMLIAESNAGSRYSELILDAGTTLNLGGLNTILGGLSGSGVVTNTAANINSILAVGYNSITTTFSGQFNRYNDALPGSVALVKIGSANLILTGAANIAVNGSGVLDGMASTGGFTIQGGAAIYTGAGTGGFQTYTVASGGSLVLDDGTGGTPGAGAHQNNRLNFTTGVGTVNLNGGTFSLYGNSTVVTSEQLSSLTLGSGTGTIVLNPAAGQTLTLTTQNLTAIQAGGTAILRNLGTGGTLIATTPNAPGTQGGGAVGTGTTKNLNIRPDMLGDNIATGYDGNLAFITTVSSTTAGIGLRPLAAGEMETAAVLTGTAGSSTINYSLAASDTFANAQAANSLRLESGVTITGALPNTTSGAVFSTSAALLTENVNTGGILALGGSSTINVGQLTATGSNQLYLYTAGASTSITINAYIGNISTGLIKSLEGTVTLNKNAYYTGTTTVNDGKLVLNAGANTLIVSATAAAPTLSALVVNGTGILDLNGNNQAVSTITNNNPLPGTGGSITNSNLSTQATLISVNNSAQLVFGGTIDGNLNFSKYGNNNTILTSAESYTGATVVGGATLFLRDSGVLTNSTSVTANFATFEIDNSGLTNTATANPNRIPNVTNITLKGGTFFLNGGGTIDTIVTLPKLTLQQGFNAIQMVPAVNAGSTTILNITNLDHSSSNAATLNINAFIGQRVISGNTSQNNFQINTLGQQNLFTATQVFISNINGTPFSSASLVNNLIGGWVAANGGSFATYSDTYGVGALGQDPSFPTYDGADITAATTAAWNLNDTTTRTLTGNKTINSYQFGANTLTLATATTLTLQVGMFTNNSGTSTMTPTDATSKLTTNPGSTLYMFFNQGTNVINPIITGTIDVVKEGGGTLTMNGTFTTGATLSTPATAITGALVQNYANDFTGTFYAQGGTTNLTAAANVILIPHDLVIDNATVTMNTNSGQIAANSNIFINSGGILNLVGSNILSSLNFSNPGGTANGTANVGTLLTLSAANAINSANDNWGFVPTIAGTALAFSNAAPVITTSGVTVAGAAPTDLVISAPITNSVGVITKMGAGSLVLSGASTFTNGFNLAQGSLILAASSTLNTAGSTVVNGPIGTGSLIIGDGSPGSNVTLQSDGTARVLANNVTMNGNVTFGGSVAGNNVTLNGTVNLGAATRTFTVTNPLVTATIGGQIIGGAGAGLTKAGAGVLLLNNSNVITPNNYTGPTTVNGGVLRLGANGTLPSTTALTVASGAVFDLGGFGQTVSSLNGGATALVTNSSTTAGSFLSVTGTGSSNYAGYIDSASTGVVTSLVLNLSGGTLTLSNTASNYAGGTNVGGGGTLVLNGGTNTAVVTGLGILAINGNGTLTGTGGVASNLVLNSGASVNILANTVTPTAGVITTVASLLVNGSTVINLTNGSPLTAGTYTLLDYTTGTLSAAQFNQLSLGTVPSGSGFSYTLVNNTAGTSVDLLVSAVAPNTPQNLTWTGNNNSSWDISTTNNWTNGSPAVYTEGSNVTFDNTGTRKVVTGSTPVAPNSITVNSNTTGAGPTLLFNAYKISTPITGSLAGGLVKTGNANLMLSGANTFSGPISVQGGLLEAVVSSSASGLGHGTVTLAAGTTLQFDPTASTATVGLNGRASITAGGLNSSINYNATANDSSTYFTTSTGLTISGGGGTNYSGVGPPVAGSNLFVVQWTGKVKITNSGYYSFFDNSDDGSRLLIDGNIAAQNDRGGGITTTPAAGSAIFLTAGLHDIVVQEQQGTGGWQTTIQYVGADTNGLLQVLGATTAATPNPVLFTPETASTAGASNAINVGNNVVTQGSATINLNGVNFTAVQIGTLTQAVGSTLTVNGLAGKQLRATATNYTAAGTYTINTTTADVALGGVTDNGNAVTIAKTGSGRLIFDAVGFNGQSSLGSTSIIDAQAGRVVLKGMAFGGTNPIGSAQLRLSGGILTLDSQGGNVAYDNAVTVTANNTVIEAVTEAVTLVLGGNTNGIALGSNNLIIDTFGGVRTAVGLAAPNVGATLNIAGAITGNGNITVRSTQLGLGTNLQPSNGALILSANDNGLTGSLSVLGELTLLQGATASGPTNSLPSYEGLTLNNNGSILNIAGSTGSGGTLLLKNAQLTIDDTVVNNQNRISDTQVITLNQGSIQLNANTSLGTTETVGTINSASGLNQFRNSNIAANLVSVFQGGNLVRTGNSTVQFFTSSATLGGAANNAAQFKFTQINGLSPTSTATTQTGTNVLVGGGGAAGSKNISIIPWAVGLSTPVASTPTYTFVTYDANGVRALTAAEYNTSAAAATGDNARDTGSASATIAGGKTVNSWILDSTNSTAATSITYTLSANMTVTSGALMFTNTTTSTTVGNALVLTGSNVTFGTEGNIFVMTTGGATISSTLTGSNGITVSGIGQLTLNANNAATLTGTVTVNGTTLAINADNNLGAATNGLQFGGGVVRFAAAGISLVNTHTVTLLANSFGGFDTGANAGTVNGQITGAGDLLKVGGNNLTLNNTSASANNFTGRLLINGGGVIVSSTQINTSTGIVNNGNLGLAATTAGMNFTETSAVVGGSAYSYNGNISGTGSVSINLGGTGGTFTFGGVNTYGGGTAVTTANSTLIGNDTNLNNFITLATTTSGLQFNQTTNATSFATIAGTGFMTKTGVGLLTMTNASTYSGLTTLTGTNAGLGTSGGLSVSAANQLGTGGLVISGNGMLQATTAQFATSAVTVDFGTRTLVIGAGGANLDVTSFTNGYDVDTAPNIMKIGGVISGAPADALTKTGTGTLVLSGANTYGGNTFVNAGTLQLGASNVIPDGAGKGNVTLAGGAVLDLNGFTDTINGLNGAGVVDDTAPASTSSLVVGNNDQSGNFSGVIQNSGAGATTNLVKIGTGTQILSGASTYKGTTSIQNGALSVSTLANVGAASSNLGAPTTVAAGTIDFGQVGTTGTLIITGAGGSTDRVVNFAGAGATIENDGSAPVTFTSNTTAVQGAPSNTTFTLQGTNAGANSFNGNIVDPAGQQTSLVKTQAGNWVVNGTNNYTGTTTLTSGGLQVGNAATAATARTGTGAFTANGGTLSGTGTVQGAATFNSGSTLAPGDNFGAGVANLKFSNGLTMTAGSSTSMQINSATLNDANIQTAWLAGQATYAAYINSNATTYDNTAVPAGSHDAISVTGLLSLNSGSPINVGGTYTGNSWDVIDLLDWSSFVANGFTPGGDVNGYRDGGTDGNLTLPTLSAGYKYDVSHFLSQGFIVVVPEPSRALLMMFGVAMLFLRRRRRAE